MRFSLGSGFLYLNKEVSKQICPVWQRGQKDWIHAHVEARGGGGGGDIPPFCFGVPLFTPPSPPPPPPDFFSYLGLVLSPSCLRTRMSRNSSLESQAFVMRASTGNRLLFVADSVFFKTNSL